MLSIIIPQLNKSEMTENCIDSIVDVTSEPYEIVLVDNGSIDVISEEHKKRVVYVRSETNLNFAGGCNLGASKTTGDKLCFLNNDTVALYDWEKAADLLSNEIGIVGSKLLYPDGTLQHAGMEHIELRPGEPVSFEHRFRGKAGNHTEANVDAICPVVTGACLFITKADFDEVKGFDEEYRNWFEDVDLCFKVRYELNKKILYSHKSKLVHLESATGKELNMTPMHVHSRVYFYQKWGNIFPSERALWIN